MTGARFILRFDDVCPTMDWKTWDRIERKLDEEGIRPLLAVVPDNQDANLMVAPAREAFWSEVRRWQAKGWAIGLHGLTHVYSTTSSGIVGLNGRSEFAGLAYEEQRRKLEDGLLIFRREGIRAVAWIAPAHSFDDVTLAALRDVGLSIVSDGFYRLPHVDVQGTVWVPQQLWRLRDASSGVWTVCYHINPWSDEDVASFARDVTAFRSRIIPFEDAVREGHARKREFSDKVYSRWRLATIRTRNMLGRGKARLLGGR